MRCLLPLQGACDSWVRQGVPPTGFWPQVLVLGNDCEGRVCICARSQGPVSIRPLRLQTHALESLPGARLHLQATWQVRDLCCCMRVLINSVANACTELDGQRILVKGISDQSRRLVATCAYS